MAEKRLVLSDSSPLIALAAAGGFGLLRGLFGLVSITAQVRDEVLAGGDRVGATELRRALRARWIRVRRVPKDAPAFPNLGAGEASALGAAVASGGDCYLVIDDESARREARARGLDFTGTLGVLIVAKRCGLIPAVKPLLARLVEHGFYLSPELGQSVLDEAGEH